MPIFQEDDVGDHDSLGEYPETLVSSTSTQINMEKTSEMKTQMDIYKKMIHETQAMEWEPTQRLPFLERLKMERLKKGESLTRNSNQHIDSLPKGHESRSTETPNLQTTESTPLLPPAELQQGSRTSLESSQIHSGLNPIRSLLHSGDFTQEAVSKKENRREAIDTSYVPTPAPWMTTSPPRGLPFQVDSRFPRAAPASGRERHARVPSLSSSMSQSFVFQAPTSPLVHIENNEDLEHGSAMDIGAGSSKLSRRHTLETSHATSSPALPAHFNPNRPLPNLRRDNVLPYQAHQPRRSLTLSASFQDVSNSPPFLRSRRPSFTSETQPLHMVGSYEESILRGRMSSSLSKPFQFIADIGVLDTTKNANSYKSTPSHVILPFSASYFNYGTISDGSMAESEDRPSPYVGTIDLENGIKPKRKKRPKVNKDDDDQQPLPQPEDAKEKTGLRAPPGGSYRIPKKGKLQVIIKNQEKTGFRPFFVPYDLAGMKSGTKTFVRHRVFTEPPVVDGPVSYSNGRGKRPSGMPIIRYLLDFQICSPCKGRYFLYKSIRVVFPNREPDGKLLVETTFPEPKYSPWKPEINTNGFIAGDTADKESPSRSSRFSLANSANSGVPPSGLASKTKKKSAKSSEREKIEVARFSHEIDGGVNDGTPISPIPVTLDFKRKPISSRPASSSSQISNERSAMSENGTLSQVSTGDSNSKSNTDNMDLDNGNGNRSFTNKTTCDKQSNVDIEYAGNESAGSYENEFERRMRKLGISISTGNLTNMDFKTLVADAIDKMSDEEFEDFKRDDWADRVDGTMNGES